ncbi:universal stress protein [Peijinzhouia sedimentorum]|tara:strand:+ start:817 stop:1659 length:843 start_codon:yes stop_codon:yes gene_type:complete
MNKIKKILVPTDLSDNAENAMMYAFDLAKKSGARVAVFYSFDRYHTQEGNSTEVYDLAKESADNALEQHVADALAKGSYSSVSYNLHTLPESFMEGMKEIIDISDADLIVMGTKGASGLKEVWVGSNTVSVIEKVKLPIMVVPVEATFKEISKILFMTDLKPIKDDSALDVLSEIARLSNAKVRIANVKDEGEHSNWEERLERSRIGHVIGDDVRHSFHKIENKNVLEGISKYVENKGDIDMIALVTRKKNLFDRLFRTEHAKEMAFRSLLPLLILHDND